MKKGSFDTETESKKLIWLLASFVLLAALVLLLVIYSPAPAAVEKNDAVLSFSAEPGFYDTDLSLEISCNHKDYVIYYTLDGSTPGPDSLVYSGVIELTDASSQENRYSMRTDISTGFFHDLVKEYGYLETGFEVPDYKLDKCNVVRAVAVDSEGRCSDILTGSFFIGFDDKSAYEGIDVVSIVTDPDNLFDYNTGIYVLGKYYDIYKLNSLIIPRKNNWLWWDANYRHQGKDWEREAEICSWDAQRLLKLDNYCGIRVHGNISRGRLPRSLAVYAYDYDGQIASFSGDVFANGYEAEKLVLYGQEPKRRLKEYVISRAVSSLNVSSLNYKPCALFLNGEYWGNYNIGEKYDACYISEFFGLEKENIYLVKDNEDIAGGSAALRAYKKMHSWISSHDMTVTENYDRALEMIDIDSYIDYFALQIYIYNNDWPNKNYACWRSITNIGDGFEDGKWRWMLFDVNQSSVADKDNANIDLVEHAMINDSMFASLMQSDVFRKQFYVKLSSLADDVFSFENIMALENEYDELTALARINENSRFYGDSNEAEHEYIESLGSFNMFMIQRASFIKQQCEEEYLPFDIKGLNSFKSKGIEAGIILYFLYGFIGILLILFVLDIIMNRRKDGRK